jgi:CheY-like chemotaxis protein
MEDGQYDWISRRAHQLWEDEGRPSGRDKEHWARAVAELEEEQRRSSDSIAARKGEPGVVLVVEDEPLIRFATVDALEDAGFEVLEAANADEALVLLGSTPVDAVFTDINLPGSLDGLGLAARVRTIYPRTRIVVTSGHVSLGAFDLASGVSFLPKPYAYASLIRLLESK